MSNQRGRMIRRASRLRKPPVYCLRFDRSKYYGAAAILRKHLIEALEPLLGKKMARIAVGGDADD